MYYSYLLLECIMAHALYYMLPLGGLLLSSPMPSHAQENFFQWHSTNVQLLQGWDYALGSQERTIATLEHSHGWKYGDFFGFLDYTWPEGGERNYYFEVAPRLSFSKMTGRNLSYGIIKDLLISTTIDKPEGKEERYLYGLGVDLDIDGFKYLKTNWLVRDDPALDGETYQLTVSWNRPFDIAGNNYLIEGFADFAGSEGNTSSNQLIVPRFLFDVGQVAGIKEKQLWMGVEWQYWHNKFGIKGKTESVPQLQAKWVF